MVEMCASISPESAPIQAMSACALAERIASSRESAPICTIASLQESSLVSRDEALEFGLPASQ